MEDKIIGYHADSAPPLVETDDRLEAWEEFCQGTYPGYGATEFEARAYASLTEVLDEVEYGDMMSLMANRHYWASTPQMQHLAYEEDHRIAKLASLLLHHGWEPPVNIAYTNMSGDHVVQPHDLERIDYGEMMQDLN